MAVPNDPMTTSTTHHHRRGRDPEARRLNRSATTTSTDLKLTGMHGRLVVRSWSAPEPTLVAVVAHGYGEYSARYGHVAEPLTHNGAVVYAPDHAGHGRSEGVRAHPSMVEDMATDLHTVVARVLTDHRGLPLVLIGHSLGGSVATRYVQRYGTRELSALVLSAPFVGGNPAFIGMLDLDPFPQLPIDPSLLSRDPRIGETYADDPLVYSGPIDRDVLESVKEAVHVIAEGGDFADLPTLWLQGTKDGLAPVELNWKAMEIIGGRALLEKIYPGARHEVFNETNADEVLGDLIAFIDKHVHTR